MKLFITLLSFLIFHTAYSQKHMYAYDSLHFMPDAACIIAEVKNVSKGKAVLTVIKVLGTGHGAAPVLQVGTEISVHVPGKKYEPLVGSVIETNIKQKVKMGSVDQPSYFMLQPRTINEKEWKLKDKRDE